MSEPLVELTIRIRKDAKERLKAAAERLQTTPSEIARTAIESWLAGGNLERPPDAPARVTDVESIVARAVWAVLASLHTQLDEDGAEKETRELFFGMDAPKF